MIAHTTKRNAAHSGNSQVESPGCGSLGEPEDSDDASMSNPGAIYYAHSPDAHGRWHPLQEHLRSVGAGAGAFAQGWPWVDEARLAGLLHDLGKYGDSFQARLRGEASGLDHWSVGALEAFQSHQALGAALSIEGHHVGLQPALSVAERLRQVLQG